MFSLCYPNIMMHQEIYLYCPCFYIILLSSGLPFVTWVDRMLTASNRRHCTCFLCLYISEPRISIILFLMFIATLSTQRRHHQVPLHQHSAGALKHININLGDFYIYFLMHHNVLDIRG